MKSSLNKNNSPHSEVHSGHKNVEKLAMQSWHGNTVVLLGAAGAMGNCFLRLFATLPIKLVAVDFSTGLAKISKQNYANCAAEVSYILPEEALIAVRSASCVIFSLPLKKTTLVMQQFLPLVKSGALVFDLSSVKQPYFELMEKESGKDVCVIGAHPLFGPYPDVAGETMVLVPGKNSELWMEKLQQALQYFLLKTVVSTAQIHDTRVAYSQALLHVMLFSFVEAIGKQGQTTEDLIPFATPLYRFEMDLAARLLCQKSDLYAAIALQNNESLQAFTNMHKALGDFINLLKNKDYEGYEQKIESLTSFFSNLELAAMRSKHLIEDEIVSKKNEKK